MTRSRTRVRGGFLTTGPTMAMDSRSRFRDDEEPDTIEVHNYLDDPDYTVAGENIAPHDRQRDDEEPEEEEDGEVVARYPASYHVATEDDEIVVYSRAPQHKTDRFDMDTDARKTRDGRPPQTVAELNALHLRHYGRGGRRAMPVR